MVGSARQSGTFSDWLRPRWGWGFRSWGQTLDLWRQVSTPNFWPLRPPAPRMFSRRNAATQNPQSKYRRTPGPGDARETRGDLNRSSEISDAPAGARGWGDASSFWSVHANPRILTRRRPLGSPRASLGRPNSGEGAARGGGSPCESKPFPAARLLQKTRNQPIRPPRFLASLHFPVFRAIRARTQLQRRGPTHILSVPRIALIYLPPPSSLSVSLSLSISLSAAAPFRPSFYCATNFRQLPLLLTNER